MFSHISFKGFFNFYTLAVLAYKLNIKIGLYVCHSSEFLWLAGWP